MPRSSDTAALRKARGAFFTPDELCVFLAEWVVRSPSDRILEPSCGEAAFLVSVGERLRSLGARDVPAQLFGVELHEDSARLALKFLEAEGLSATISVGDFFEVELPSSFDAVVGNPPYVRYQGFVGAERLKSQHAARAQGVALTGLASSWASFVVHASNFLNADGRLGLVLPAELLTVNYAAEVRAFLLRRFASVRLVVFEHRVFPNVTEEVVLLLAEGSGGTDDVEIHFCEGLGDLRKTVAGLPRWRPPSPTAKWSAALLHRDGADTYARVTETGRFETLSKWGDPDLGMVTGNNAYFAITSDTVRRLRLPASELLRISPPGSRHLRGLTFTDGRWAEMLREGSRGYLFRPDANRPSKGALAYIAEGETEGVNLAYKCRIRNTWWRVPLTPVPDLFLTYMNHDAPRLVTNRAAARHLNSIHGLILKPERRRIGNDLLPLAMLNSATLLGAELVGRSYGGGILKLEPKEADTLPVPSLATVEASAPVLREMRSSVARLLASGNLVEAVSRVDDALLRGTARLTRAEMKSLVDSREALFARRRARKRV